MTTIEERLAAMGWQLPEAAAPLASYVPFAQTRNLIFVSGQLPFKNGEIITGRLGDNMATEEGRVAAEACAIGIIAQIKGALNGEFGRIRKLMKLEGFVASTPDFTEHPEVINGASDLMVELFGTRGQHSRAAVGVSSLPRGAAVEIAATFSVD
ncbi:MAG: RidA family protein [Pseudomonadota bacterium]